MAVGKHNLSTLHPVSGVSISAVEANIKYPDRKDLCLIEIAPKAKISGVFTQNAFCAAPVSISKRHLEKQYLAKASNNQFRYLLINTGYANAGTGPLGDKNALQTCESVAQQAGVALEQVLPFSTGVIGEQMPLERMNQGIAKCFDQGFSDDSWLEAAEAILTTDTRTKAKSVQLEIDGKLITISGIAKGSGMIRPDMATMLAYIATDADISQQALDKIIKQAADQSFNRITVDGDTSTNDSFILIATGVAEGNLIGDEVEDKGSDAFVRISEAITELAVFLAQEIIRDGEGATKLITVQVEGGESIEACEQVAYTVAHSPLTKTAFFAGDPNWGRILAAVGRSGLNNLDVSQVSIYLDDVCIVSDGFVDSAYQEQDGQQVMNKEEITVRINLGRGSESACVWTSDLSYDYVKINAEYRS